MILPKITIWNLALGVSPVVVLKWWTHNCRFESFDPSTDIVGGSTFFRRYNPHRNPTFHDLCVRQTAVSNMNPKLIEDHKEGGSKLIEAFSAALWASWTYTVQRKYLQFYHYSPATVHQLWTRIDLLRSDYEAGTEITDHFVVLAKTSSSILLRCGDSPRNTPCGPRDVDGLFEISLKIDDDRGTAEFRLKSFFFYGLIKTNTSPIRTMSVEGFLHKQYAMLLMESGLRGCMK